MPAAKQMWMDRAIGAVAPAWQLQRVRARLATDFVLRHYEGSAVGRRTQNWNRAAGDANAVHGGMALARLREVARDLVRNNPYAESAVTTIADHAVGWGIVAKPTEKNDRLTRAWKAWAETAVCDTDGRHDFYGLQKLVMKTVVESGECLVRRRWRRLEDGLPLPLQLQVLEPDLLDTSRTQALPNGGQIVQGVEFDALGKRAGYWLFPTHPGSSVNTSTGGTLFSAAKRVPASEVQHIFKSKRPGQVRGPSWFAPTILRLKDFDEYEDATLMKQKIAACLAVITSDVDGSAGAIGSADDADDPTTDTLEPGAIINAPPGRTIQIVQPPAVREHGDFCQVTLRAIATGIGVTYEDLTGDYTNMPYSAARMSRLRHWARVDDWRWHMLIPQFCDPVWSWAMEAAQILGLASGLPTARWTPPPPAMIDPANEGLAYQRNIRTGLQSLSDALRERGYDPEEVLAEIAADNKKLDELGLVLDSDPRKMSQAGQAQSIPDATAKGASS